MDRRTGFILLYVHNRYLQYQERKKTSSSNTIWQLASQVMTIPMLILRCSPLLIVNRGVARTGTSWTILVFTIIRQCLITVDWNRVRCVCVARLNHHWRSPIFIMDEGTLLAYWKHPNISFTRKTFETYHRDSSESCETVDRAPLCDSNCAIHQRHEQMYNHRWIYTDHFRDNIYRVRSYIWNCSSRTKSSYPYRSQSLDHRESSRRQYSARVSCPRTDQSSIREQRPGDYLRRLGCIVSNRRVHHGKTSVQTSAYVVLLRVASEIHTCRRIQPINVQHNSFYEKRDEFLPYLCTSDRSSLPMSYPFDCNGGYHSYLFVKMNEEYYTLSMLFACERHTVGRTNRYAYGSKNNNNNQTKREKQCFLSSFCLRIG